MLSEGRMVGPYKLVRSLGAGTFGEVWLATHLDLGRDFALRISTDPEYVKQLRKEGVITFNVRHPNIVETQQIDTWHEPHKQRAWRLTRKGEEALDAHRDELANVMVLRD